MVALADGQVVCARSVHPKPESARPTRAALINIRTGQWGATRVITQDTPTVPSKPADPPSGHSPHDPVPRGLRITRDLLEKHGLTKGCPKCEETRREYDSNTVDHNRACRKRVELEMENNAEQSQKLKDIEERQHKYLARRIEEQVSGHVGPPSSSVVGAPVGGSGPAAPPTEVLEASREGSSTSAGGVVDASPQQSIDHICHECAPQRK